MKEFERIAEHYSWQAQCLYAHLQAMYRKKKKSVNDTYGV